MRRPAGGPKDTHVQIPEPASTPPSWQKGLCRCAQVQDLRREVMLDYLGVGGPGSSRGPYERKRQSGKVM